MARLNVNPTRMELTKLRKKLHMAQRGHKLLKDKRDELMKQFLDMVRENKKLRIKVEHDLQAAYKNFSMAKALMSPKILEQAVMYPLKTASLTVGYKNIMSVDVPEFDFETSDSGDAYPYGYLFTSGELDSAIDVLSDVFASLLKLAEREKTVDLLADEIEKTRRRVNALEHLMIPQLQETIKYIVMKLDENERGNLTRLMKVKDMMIAEKIEQKA